MSACSSYQTKINKPFNMLVNHDALGAAEILKPQAETEGNDQLVYLLEYGIALHEAGKFEESINVFQKAYDMVEIKDYHSISRIAGSFLINDSLIQYKGDDFEKVLVNVYLAINYLMVGKYEDAAVEARRVNEILYKFKNEAKRDYTQNPFARYLSAIIWENDRKWDDMYIDYKNTYDLAPSFLPVRKDLIWGAKRAQRPDEFKQWKSTFKDTESEKQRDDKEVGELVFIYQQGLGPQKRPDPGFPRIPHIYARMTSGIAAQVELIPIASGAEANEKFVARTERIFNITDTAMKTLNDEYGAMIAKKIGGIAAKAVVSDQIRQKNKLLGDIAWIAMNVADQADLRHWSTLPETFQISRQFVKAGKYKVHASALGSSGELTGETMSEKEIEIFPRKKIFLTWRSFK